MAGVSSHPRRLGRPRDKRTDLAIMVAARKLLAERGFESFSLEAISQQTGISRTTIYRRWPSKTHLAFEIAYGGGGGIPDVILQHGLDAQISVFIEQVYAQYERKEVGAASIGLSTAFHRSHTLRKELNGSVEFGTHQEWTRILQKGQAAGLVRRDADPVTYFDVIVGAVLFRAIFSEMPMAEKMVSEITKIVVRGLTPI